MKPNPLNRKALLKKPFRKADREYKAILIVPAGTKHESGYMHIAVIGEYVVDGKLKYEICAYPDDIEWDLSGVTQKYPSSGMRTDCWYPEGILHVWGGGAFKVEFPAMSSTEIKFVPRS